MLHAMYKHPNTSRVCRISRSLYSSLVAKNELSFSSKLLPLYPLPLSSVQNYFLKNNFLCATTATVLHMCPYYSKGMSFLEGHVISHSCKLAVFSPLEKGMRKTQPPDETGVVSCSQKGVVICICKILCITLFISV